MIENTKPAERLIEEWQAGSNREENFRCLFERYSRPIADFFKNRGFSNEECRDLTQETFLGVYQGIADFRLDSSFETWLFRIARNRWCNAVRDRSRKKRAAQEVPLDEGPDADRDSAFLAAVDLGSSGENAGPLTHVLVEESLRLLRDAVTELPPVQQRLFLLRFGEELKYREIATVMGIPEGTVKSQLSRARESLKEVLGDHYTNINI